ncbi:MAG: DnaA regulatory inactivator Hda [Endozoicomonadaceae bacterium]|nr:DnaA regulatory inactivator Hda [Endozoicomonadaceae bacterium]
MINSLLQLPLGIQLRDDATFDNYLPGPNRTALSVLCQTNSSGNLPVEQFIYLYGVPGSGCTHLLQAACYEAHHLKQQSVYLPVNKLIHYSPKLLESMENLDLICIDNINALANNHQWEEAIFHLFNRVRDTGNRLIIGGNSAPRQLNLNLEDLTSRLSWGLVVQILPLNDNEKCAALRLRAQLRGFEISDDVARYILHYSPRNMHKLFHILAVLDEASLSAKRKLSIPFVREVMHCYHQ